MSEERVPDKKIILKSSDGTTEIMHLYRAEQWKSKFRYGRFNIYPRRGAFYTNMYRVYLNGVVQGSKAKYHFFTWDEILDMIKNIMEESLDETNS